MSERSDLGWVLRRRMATQRLTGAPLRTAADVVGLLTAVQSQDPPLAWWSLGLRCRRATQAAVLAEQAGGGFVRLHILRPTWHYVVPADLRWLTRLTGPKVERSMGARHRQLGLDTAAAGAALDALTGQLAGGRARTRKELGAALGGAGAGWPGERVGHVLLLGEVRGLLCSGPPKGTEHTHVLVDEVVAPSAADDASAEDAARRLTHRFFAGHGPATERDLARWSGMTLGQIRTALADLGDTLTNVELGGVTLWFDAAVTARATRQDDAYLLPTFDEATLTYPGHGFPRRGTADRSRLFAEAARGTVVVDGYDVGVFRRTVGPAGIRIAVFPDATLGADERTAIGAAAERLAAFAGRPLAALDLG